MNWQALLDFQRLRTSSALAGVLAVLLAPDALAQEVLRGSLVTSPSVMRWSGVYGGGQLNYNIATADFGNTTQPLTNYILRNSILLDEVAGFTTLPKGSTTGQGYGGFIGYNMQWDDMVVGLEANYNRTSLTKSASDSLSRSFIDNGQALPDHVNTYNMTVSANSSVLLTDLATARLRAGWAIGSLLPYGFVGLAVGRADVVTNATVTGTVTDTDTTVNPNTSTTAALILPGPQTTSRKGVFAYGGTIGLGLDWALTQNIFLRGEWELVKLQKIEGVDMRINTARAAIGLKF